MQAGAGRHHSCCIPPSGRGGGLIHTFGMTCTQTKEWRHHRVRCQAGTGHRARTLICH